MHTLQIDNDWRLIHNADPSDDDTVLIIKEKPGEEPEECIEIPFGVLKGFIASFIRKEKIEKLESMSVDEILGVDHG